MSVKTYKSYAAAARRVEVLRKRGVWPAVIGTDDTGYRLTYEPPDPAASGNTERTASLAEVAATGRQQQRAALEAMFGSNAEVIFNVCAKMAGPQVSDNVSAALAWGLRQRITSGELQPGQRLPTTGELAAEHHVSRATVG